MAKAKAKVISITIQKGGTGKSTSTYNLAHLLAARGCRVLAVDLDPQHSLTRFFDLADKAESGEVATTLQLLDGADWTATKVADNLWVLPANSELAAVELEAYSNPSWGTMLKNGLEEAADSYDYILIDAPPSLSVLTTNAVMAADGIIVPVETEAEAVKGLELLLRTMNKTVGKMRRGWKMQDAIIAILPTKHDRRRLHHKEVLAGLQQVYGGLVSTPIKDATAYPDSTSGHQPIYVYAPEQRGPWDELVSRVERWSANGK